MDLLDVISVLDESVLEHSVLSPNGDIDAEFVNSWVNVGGEVVGCSVDDDDFSMVDRICLLPSDDGVRLVVGYLVSDRLLFAGYLISVVSSFVVS